MYKPCYSTVRNTDIENCYFIIEYVITTIGGQKYAKELMCIKGDPVLWEYKWNDRYCNLRIQITDYVECSEYEYYKYLNV